MKKDMSGSGSATGTHRGPVGRASGRASADHGRSEASAAAVEREFDPPHQQKRQILQERAKALAREPEKENGQEGLIDVVEFRLAHERYAIESAHIREVYRMKEITPVPCTPPFVLGIINVRGQILSVIDIKRLFDLPEEGLTDLNKVIIVHSDEMELGILADVVVGARPIAREDIQPPLPTLTGIGADYLRGVTQGNLVILDVARILADEAIVVHEEVAI